MSLAVNVNEERCNIKTIDESGVDFIINLHILGYSAREWVVEAVNMYNILHSRNLLGTIKVMMCKWME